MGYALLVGAILLPMDSSRDLAAQGPPVDSASEAQQRTRIDPGLEKILLRWGRSMDGSERMECRFDRFRYDDIFKVEFRATGKLSIEREGNADYECEPRKIDMVAVSRKKDRTGHPFALKCDEAETLQFTKDGATGAKAGFVQPYPFTRLPIAPFLINVSRRELVNNFDIRIVSQTPEQIRLEFIPRLEPYKSWYSSAELILNREGFVPFALRTCDPSGKAETVHVLRDVRYVKAKN